MTPVEWAGAALGVGVVTSGVASRPKGPAGRWRIVLEVLLSLGGTVLAMLGAVWAAREAGQKVGNAAIWLGAGAAHPLVAAGLGCALLGIEIGTALRRDSVQHPLVQLVWSAAIGALLATVVLPKAPGHAFEVRAGEVSATVLAVGLLVRLGAGVWVRKTIPADVVVPPSTETPSAPTWVVRAPLGDGDRLDFCLGEWERVLAQAGPVAGKPRDHKRHDTFLCRRPRGLRRYCRRLARVHLVVTGLLTSATLAVVVGLARAGEAGQTVLFAWWAGALAALALGYLIRSLPVRRRLEDLIPEAAPSPPALVAYPEFDLPGAGLEEVLLAHVPHTEAEPCRRCAGSGRVETTAYEVTGGGWHSQVVHNPYHGLAGGDAPDHIEQVYESPSSVSRQVQIPCDTCKGSGHVPRRLLPEEREQRARQRASRLRNLASREASVHAAIDTENHRRIYSHALDRAFFDALDG